VSQVSGVHQRVLVGRALPGAQPHETRSPERVVLPVSASDAPWSHADATREVLRTLALGGATLARYAPEPDSAPGP